MDLTLDLRLRPPTGDDATAIAELTTAAEEVDDTGEHYSADDWLEELDNPLIDPSRDWLLAEVDGRLVASTLLSPRAPSDGVLAVAIEGVVRPSHRGLGIGSTLLSRMQRRAREYVAERGAGLSPLLRAQVRTDDEAATGLMESHGFSPARWNFVMEADLSRPAPAAAELAGYEVTTWEGVDDDEVREAHNLAFLDHPGFTRWSAEMWHQHVSGSRAHRPALSLVARDEAGEIAAYLQLAEFEAVQQATGKREAFVAKVGTLPGHRRRGLAAGLLARALELSRGAGYDVSALDVDSENPTGALRVYERAGFEVVRTFTRYELSQTEET